MRPIRDWRLASLILLCVVINSAYAQTGANSHVATKISSNAGEKAMRIRIVLSNQILTAHLENNPSARDFFSMLPMTLTLSDYASTEKIGYLPRKLTLAAAPEGIDPAPGDIAYYAPWGNLAFFYKDFGYSKGLIRLGVLETGSDILRGSKDFTVRIEAAE